MVQNHTLKPDKVEAVAILSLINGILNILWGLGLSLLAGVTIVGICCIPWTILPTILGAFEVVYAAKLLASDPRAVKPAKAIAILDILCILEGNFISMVVGILLLVFYADNEVENWFNQLPQVPLENSLLDLNTDQSVEPLEIEDLEQ